MAIWVNCRVWFGLVLACPYSWSFAKMDFCLQFAVWVAVLTSYIHVGARDFANEQAFAILCLSFIHDLFHIIPYSSFKEKFA